MSKKIYWSLCVDQHGTPFNLVVRAGDEEEARRHIRLLDSTLSVVELDDITGSGEPGVLRSLMRASERFDSYTTKLASQLEGTRLALQLSEGLVEVVRRELQEIRSRLDHALERIDPSGEIQRLQAELDRLKTFARALGDHAREAQDGYLVPAEEFDELQKLTQGPRVAPVLRGGFRRST